MLNVLVLCSGTGKSPQAEQALLMARGYAESGRVQPLVGCADASWLAHAAGSLRLPCARAFSKGFSGMQELRRLRAMLKSGLWLLHSHDGAAAMLATRLLSRQRVVPFVHTRHSPIEVEPRKAYAAYSRATSVICATQETAYAMAQARVSHQLLRVLPDAVDPAPFAVVHRKKDQNRVILLCPGSFETGNGQDTLLRALALLHEQGKMENWGEWELRLCGSGPLLPSLLHMANALGIGEHLIVLDENNLMNMVEDATLLLASGESQAGCNSHIFTAWAARVPLVCSDSLANKELVRDGENGILYPCANPELLGEKLLLSATDVALHETLTNRGQLALANYVYQKICSRYLGAYADLGVPFL